LDDSDGGGSGELLRGKTSGGSKSLCSRDFTNCVSRRCRIQSPNYPGFYPRNTTCAYHVHVRRSDVPKGQHALIELTQSSSTRINLRAQTVRKYGSEDKSLGLGADCDSVGDRVTVYDGSSASDAPLISFCRGSAIPPVTSSGRDVLVVFESSPFAPPEMAANSANGFELDVAVKFVPDDSMRFAKNPRQCRFQINSFDDDGSQGIVSNVAHALAANTTCRYDFVGRPGEVVWLTFRKFEVLHHKKDIYRSANCLSKMSLYDTKRSQLTRTNRVGEFCEESPPKLCDHAYMQSFKGKRVKENNMFRACVGRNETYVSWGSEFSLVEYVGESTAVTSLNFVVAYEFVDTVQDGVMVVNKEEEEPVQMKNQPDRWSCDRVFDSSSYALRRSSPLNTFPFATPRNVFLFGRGGSTDLRCSYTFTGRPGERVRLEISGITAGGRRNRGRCLPSSEHDVLPGMCSPTSTDGADDDTELRVYVSELPDGNTPVRQHCLCEELSTYNGWTFISNTSILRLEFVLQNMRSDMDYDDFNLSGRFSFVHEQSCQLRKLATGAGGEILLTTNTFCNDQPWVIQASQPGKYIFLKVTGSVIFQGESDGSGLRNSTALDVSSWCQTRDRIFIYSGNNVTVVCPMTGRLSSMGGVRSVDLFSDGWAEAQIPILLPSSSKRRSSISSVIVNYVGRSGSGPYLLQWLELSPTPDKADALTVFHDSAAGRSGGLTMAHDGSSTSSSSFSSSSSSCAFSCPELSGCIRAELYCDGIRHCPSGFDEKEENCEHVFAPLLYMYGVAIITATVVICIIIIVVQRMRSSRSIFFSTSSLAANEDGDDDACGMIIGGGAVLAAYNPSAGINGGTLYNGEYHESITNLTKSASMANGDHGMMEAVLSNHEHPENNGVS
jgi:hypothetical protein